MSYNCFTVKGKKLLGQLISPIQISDLYYQDSKFTISKPKRKWYKALWDTGSTETFISKRVLSDHILNHAEPLSVNQIFSSVITPTYLIDLYFPDGRGVVKGVKAGLGDFVGKGFDVLIGMNVITLGDLAVTNYENRTVFTFRYPPQGCIDFFKEWQQEHSERPPQSDENTG